MKPRIAYLIFVRPAGSRMWTQHMKPGKGIPFVSYKAIDASREAVRVMYANGYCTRVIKAELPREIDEQTTALLACGDVRYCQVL